MNKFLFILCVCVEFQVPSTVEPDSWKTTPLPINMWSVKTGGLWWQVVILKCRSFCRKCMACSCQDRLSLMTVVSQDRFHCIAYLSASCSFVRSYPISDQCADSCDSIYHLVIAVIWSIKHSYLCTYMYMMYVDAMCTWDKQWLLLDIIGTWD